jgi:hypothetical protein
MQKPTRVFTSSPFADMATERELLVKRVMPQLRQACEKHGMTWLGDIQQLYLQDYSDLATAMERVAKGLKTERTRATPRP